MTSAAMNMAEVGPPRSTVLIPLHRAWPYLSAIERNLAALPAHSQILISDRTHCDHALEVLRLRHGQDPRLRFLDRRGPGGWRRHVNALLPLVQTPMFCIVGQDDCVEPGYLEALEASLDRYPSAGLAFGRIRAVGLEEWRASELWQPPPLALGVQKPWEEALALDMQWNLGIPYRGLIRRELLLPIQPTPGGDSFADQLWVFSIALVSHLVFNGAAVYEKHYHPAATHQHWRDLSSRERAMARLREARIRLGPSHPFTRELAGGVGLRSEVIFGVRLLFDRLCEQVGVDGATRARIRTRWHNIACGH
jgi:hypothetical protein